MFVEDILLEASHAPVIAEHFLGQKEREGGLVVGAFESQNQVDIVGFNQISDFSSNVSGSLPLTCTAAQDRRAEFVVD